MTKALAPKPAYTWRDCTRIAAGIAMLLLGLAGLVLPVLQGILFLIVAAFLLAPYSRTIRKLLAWSERRFPAAHRKAQEFQDRFSRNKPHK